MEVLTEVPQTGTRLRIDADRQFEGHAGDSIMRVQGQGRDGSQVFDATYVETSAEEAKVIGALLRALRQPPQELSDEISQEVQATFGARLGGRDAHQISQIVSRVWWQNAQRLLGSQDDREQQLEHLAERFERAAASRRQAPAYGAAGNGSEHQPKVQQAQPKVQQAQRR
jgi:hypothetical protein